jgi:hypothetical protein
MRRSWRPGFGVRGIFPRFLIWMLLVEVHSFSAIAPSLNKSKSRGPMDMSTAGLTSFPDTTLPFKHVV